MAWARWARFLKFCVVGGVGFCVDGAVLTGLVDAGWVDAIVGRGISFAVAVVVTFEINRRWAFRRQRRAEQNYLTSFAAYLGVQGVGFLLNFLVYTILYFSLPAPFDAPLVCLGLASGAALLVNYTGANRIVFRERTV